MNKIGNLPARALYGFVALAMVLSMVLMGAVPLTAGTTEPVATQGPEVGPSKTFAPRSAEAGPNVTELVVYIERPTSGASFNVSNTFYVNAVVAYKDIELKDAASKSVTATIDPGPNAELVAGETASKSATILQNCVGDFWWKLHCKGQGETTITVNATASGLPVGQDSVTVIQGTPPEECDLEITIIQPTGDDCYLDVCSNFVVKAKVDNKSSTTATDANVCIDIDPDSGASVTGGEPLCWNVGDILAGRHVYVLWNMHCDDVGTVNITVNATAGGVTNICPASVLVHQGEEPPEELTDCCLNITMHAPTEVCKVGCNYSDYQVIATIGNGCAGNCSNVTATISKTVGADKASITSPLTQNVGTLVPGASQNVTWNVTCVKLGAVTFKVEAQGDETLCCAEGTATVEQKKILIDLVEPESGTTIYHNICQTFNVTANITNCDCFPLGNVTIQLDLPDSVCIVANTTIHVTQYNENGVMVEEWDIDPNELDDPEKITEFTMCACCIYTIEWIDLHCCDDTPNYGQTAETIYIKVFDGAELKDWDYFLVKQTEKAHLAAGVEVYLGTTEADGPVGCNMSTTPAEAVAVNQSFVVVVPVINMGMAAAQNVSVNVTITGTANCTGNHSFDLGTILGRSAKKAFISCNCSGDGAVNITISALSGNDAVKRINHPRDPDLYAIPEDNIFPCGNKVIKQIPITIEIIQPYDGETFTCCDDFVVKVMVANNSTISGNDLNGVNATITWVGPASFNPGYPSGYATKDLGDLKAGNHTYVGWNFHCDDDSDVVFTITIESTNPVWSDTVSVTVHQIPNAVLDVDILSPMDSSVYRTSEEFAVTANVTVVSANLGSVAGVYASISHCGALGVVGSTSIQLGTMAENQTKIVSWTVHAVEAGTQCAYADCDITVSAYAPCAQYGYYTKTVRLYPAANLLVEIIDYPDEDIIKCNNFTVTTRVTNIGWADATGVKLLLSVIPEDSVRPVKGDNSYEKDIGTLLGYGKSGEEDVGYTVVNWTLHCKIACESTITITPFGYDECGWHPLYPIVVGEKPRGNGYVWVSLPGREIEDKFLHYDSVTVKQVEPPELVMDIIFPADGAEFQEGDSFVVSGTVSNIGKETATNVTATLTVDPSTSATITDAAKSLGDIAKGQAKVVIWAVDCDNAGYSVFTASAEANNADDALDTVTVKQGAVAAAQLVVDITYPSDGDEFYGGDEPDEFVVTAKITNIGEQAATSVDATIAIRDGDPAELVTPPAATQTIASIPAGESQNVTWNLVAANATGSAVITVTAVGPNTALDVVTVKIDPAPVQALFEGANPIAYQGNTDYLPEALTNIEDKLVIIWQRDATTGGAWHRFYFYGGYPMGEIEKLVENNAYIVVVSENCGWNLVH